MPRWGFYGGLAPWWWVTRLGIWFVVVVLVVVLFIWLLRQGGGVRQGPARPSDGDRALAILRERFARGEITREQFEEMRRALE